MNFVSMSVKFETEVAEFSDAARSISMRVTTILLAISAYSYSVFGAIYLAIGLVSVNVSSHSLPFAGLEIHFPISTFHSGSSGFPRRFRRFRAR